MARNSDPPPPPTGGASLIIQLHARFHSNRKMYGNYCSIESCDKKVSIGQGLGAERIVIDAVFTLTNLK